MKFVFTSFYKAQRLSNLCFPSSCVVKQPILLTKSFCLQIVPKYIQATFGPGGSVVEHPLREQEVVGSNPGRAIPKMLKMSPVVTLLGAQHYKASIGFSSSNKYRTTNIATLTKRSLNKNGR